jgi:hypothetical protein
MAGKQREHDQPQGGDKEQHRYRPRTLSEQAKERLESGEATRPGGDDHDEPRTAGVQGNNPGATHHD